MGKYVDTDYYINVYNGEYSDQSELERLILRAEDEIDIETLFRINNFNKLSERSKSLIKKAVCIQAEYFINNGTDLENGSVSLGSFSYSSNNQASKSLCFKALTVLKLTGLMYRGIDTI